MNALRHRFLELTIATLIAIAGFPTFAQDNDEQLKITALEALMNAPPERALPIVSRVLDGNGSDELKERALFVLSQIDHPEAQATLAGFVANGEGEMRLEAIRMIGISGNPESLEALAEVYASGDEDVKDAVLEAYLIADDEDAIYQIAASTDNPDEFESAVEMLAAMGAREKLRSLRGRAGMEEFLIEAFAISGDVESLQALATDNSNPAQQAEAIRALGIAGGDEVSSMLTEIYRNAGSADVREAALEGLLVAGDDAAVLALFRASTDKTEKRKLLEILVVMDSDAVWDIVDATLEDAQ